MADLAFGRRMDEGRECDERTTNAKGMKKRKAKTGGVPRLSGRAVDGNEYQIPINLTEGWTDMAGRRDGGKEDSGGVGGESVSLAPQSVA